MIKKDLVVLSVVLGLAGCSGYFGQDAQKDGKNAVSTLALSGGGYLSSDTASDITPFLYRNAANGKVYLFFASDRDGNNMDIFYAEMDASGMFTALSKLDSTINTAASEFSPIIFDTNGNHLLSLIRIAGQNTNLVTYKLNSSFTTTSLDSSYSGGFKHITILPVIGGYPQIYAATGTTAIQTYNYLGTGTVVMPMSALTVAFPVKGVSGYAKAANNWNFLLNMTNGQFTGLNVSGVVSQVLAYFNTPAYNSPYQDAFEFVDPVTYQVYFSSDRYGNGNFDLYRYNTLTFDKIVP